MVNAVKIRLRLKNTLPISSSVLFTIFGCFCFVFQFYVKLTI